MQDDHEDDENETILIDREEEWADVEEPLILNQVQTDVSTTTRESQVVTLYAYFLLFFQVVHKIPDRSIALLLSFIKCFSSILSKVFALPVLQRFTEHLPLTIQSARKLIPRYTIKMFVSCPSCNSLYDLNNFDFSSSKTCIYVRFPNHPQSQHRNRCNAVIMKSARLPTGKIKSYPRMIYCYHSVIDSLQQLLLRPDFIDKCEAWRNYPQETDMYNDVYDGRIWQEFQSVNGIPFLSLPFNYASLSTLTGFSPISTLYILKELFI